MKTIHPFASILLLALVACSGQNPAPVDDVAPARAPTGAATAADAAGLQVVNWGPEKVKAGEAFNRQADGSSGLWFELSGSVAGQPLQATLAGKPLAGVVGNGNVVTALVPAGYNAAPGRYPIEILFPGGTKLAAGSLVVE